MNTNNNENSNKPKRSDRYKGRQINYVFPSMEAFDAFRDRCRLHPHEGGVALAMTRVLDVLLYQFMTSTSTPEDLDKWRKSVILTSAAIDSKASWMRHPAGRPLGYSPSKEDPGSNSEDLEDLDEKNSNKETPKNHDA